MDQKNNDTCMACSCPCEEHKEHNHPVGKEQEENDDKQASDKVCVSCGAKKDEGACGCN
ncbi:MAG: hypothetical protein HYT15_03900 [Candidatus Magasanikbacteria bacterium]|nr:hypothetical protein [Candidatus Magasanikbacteria bacterium]